MCCKLSAPNRVLHEYQCVVPSVKSHVNILSLSNQSFFLVVFQDLKMKKKMQENTNDLQLISYPVSLVRSSRLYGLSYPYSPCKPNKTCKPAVSNSFLLLLTSLVPLGLTQCWTWISCHYVIFIRISHSLFIGSRIREMINPLLSGHMCSEKSLSPIKSSMCYFSA